MHQPKVTPEDLINFLVATPVNPTAMGAQRTSQAGSGEHSHDVYIRLLHRFEPSNDALWLEVKGEVCLTSGVLVPRYWF